MTLRIPAVPPPPCRWKSDPQNKPFFPLPCCSPTGPEIGQWLMSINVFETHLKTPRLLKYGQIADSRNAVYENGGELHIIPDLVCPDCQSGPDKGQEKIRGDTLSRPPQPFPAQALPSRRRNPDPQNSLCFHLPLL